MRAFRIVLGGCIDFIIFGVLIPWATIKGGGKLDAAFFSSLSLDHLFFDLSGIALIIIAAIWLFWAWFLLIKEGNGYTSELFCIKISPVTENLVVQGPFAIHRHPICIGYLVLLSGLSLAIGSFGSAVVGIPILFVFTYIYLRLFEEPCLKKRFGHDYQRYAERVPIFFPIKQNRIPMAVRNLLGDRIRFAVNIIGLSLAILLISFQLSILKGTRRQITTYIDHTGADIWAMQKGVDDFIATSSLPRETVQVIKKLKGVDRAAGIFAVYTLLQINRVKSRAYVIGYDTKSGDGGPWKLGKTLEHLKDIHGLKKNEVLLDQNLAKRHGLKPGDEVFFFGHAFTVAGFTLETMSIGSQYVFLPREVLSRILPGGKFSFTHILVWTNKEIPDEMIIQQIEKITFLNGLTNGELVTNMNDFLGMFMLPLLTVGVVMGFLVGSITIGITLYTSILERFKEYGTLKALGATDLYLYGLLLRQALISLIISVVLGLMFSVFANHFINQWVPGMTAELDGEIAMQTVFAGLVMALLSTGLPAWRLFKVDPLEAFRA